MKIHADKIETPPHHALTVRDLKRVLAAVPPAWKEGLAEVRLGNSRNGADLAYFHRYDGTLTICSRGVSLEATVSAILSEFAAIPLGIPTHYGHRFSEAETQRIHHLIDPLIEELLPAITPAEKHLDYHPSRTFRPVPLTDGA
ncbi:MAG: hypothetical protein ACAI37_04620 [Chthoniobacter sp.]